MIHRFPSIRLRQWATRHRPHSVDLASLYSVIGPSSRYQGRDGSGDADEHQIGFTPMLLRL